MTKKNIVVILLSMILTLALFVPSASAWRHRPPRVRVGLFLPPPLLSRSWFVPGFTIALAPTITGIMSGERSGFMGIGSGERSGFLIEILIG